MIDYALSVSDLILVDGFVEAMRDNNIHTIKRILFENGMDVGYKIEIRDCKHRNLQNKVFEGPRFEGFERLDSFWIKSGVASLDAVIESSKDKSLKRDLRTMSTQRTQDKAFDE